MNPTELWVLGTLIVTVAGVIGHLYRQIFSIREEMHEVAAQQLRDLWTVVNQMRVDANVDRQSAAESRVKIAENMVTKAELDRQFSRLIGEVDRRMTVAIRQRPPVRGQ